MAKKMAFISVLLVCAFCASAFGKSPKSALQSNDNQTIQPSTPATDNQPIQPSAPGTNSCNGHWVGHYRDSEKGFNTDVDLTISGDGGVWVSHLGFHNQDRSPCREHAFPVQVLKCTDTEFDFQVDGSSVWTPRGDHCPSHSSRLIRKDADTAEGPMGRSEKTLRMTRQKAD